MRQPRGSNKSSYSNWTVNALISLSITHAACEHNSFRKQSLKRVFAVLGASKSYRFYHAVETNVPPGDFCNAVRHVLLWRWQ